MSSLSIIRENIFKLAKLNCLTTYDEIANYLGINVSSVKQWLCGNRTPKLLVLDKICNKVGIPTYVLLQENANFNRNYSSTDNSSREILLENLSDYFLNKGLIFYKDKVTAFNEAVSEDMLKSYFRKIHFKTPPLETLDKMAEAMGYQTYQLIQPNGIK